MFTARGPTWITVVINHTTSGEGLINLGVQIFAVGKHQKSEIAAELAVYLSGKHNHGVTFASTLSVPEDPQLTFSLLTLLHSLNGQIDAEELVVASDNLLRFT